jgi:hypothetical protein
MNIKPLRFCLAVSALFLTGLAPGNLIAASDTTGPSEAEVKAAFQRSFRNGQADETTVTFDSPMKTGSPVTGEKAPYLGKQAFPVQVDFTVNWIFKHGEAHTVHNHKKGGVCLFYRDSVGNWDYDIQKLFTQSASESKN